MGLLPDAVSFLVAIKRAHVNYDRTLTIGRQWLMCDEPTLGRAVAAAGVTLSPEQTASVMRSPWGEALFEALGARQVDSLDVSGFEGCTIVHDLNEPLSTEYHKRYSVVFDGGSLEHVFDFPSAVRNSLATVELGGHFIANTPANGYVGHGFYQFTPELYFRVLHRSNGFHVKYLLWKTQRPGAHWYRVADPANVGHRVTRMSLFPTLLFVVAQRVDDRPIFESPPQQSDYVTAWQAAETGPADRPDVPRASYRACPSRRVWSVIPASANPVSWLGLAGAFRDERRSAAHDFQRIRLSEL